MRLNREPPPAKPLLHLVNTPTPASGSGIGPERALEAIHKNPARSAKADPPPELPCERRIDPAEPPTASRPIARTTAQNPTKNPETSQRTRTQRLKASHPSHTTRPAGGSGTDPERALEAIHKNPAHSAKADPPPRASLRAQDRSRRAPPNDQPLNPPPEATHPH